MTLFVSDMHFGRGPAEEEQAKEASLIACLEAHAETTDRLFLVGDVFDEYIEYRHLVPKGFVRFQALLARWSDRGVPIIYLAGNHDPWHLDYFQEELGVRIVPGDLVGRIYGRLIYLTHGDGIDPSTPLYRRLRPLLRHPMLTGLYRILLPADLGLALARRLNGRFQDDQIDPVRVEGLRAHAYHVLASTSADLVVMGHSHRAERCRWPDGTYLNAGAWHNDRTLARLTPDGTAHLFQWNGTRALGIESKCIEMH